ncbi:hypothetical protein NX79_00745 [Xanthomonas vasicola]|uniref:hypothetical protein n=1 Tax=Xanthomonas TaxID=338 RepID=UPI00053179CE|nr:hypothetical protein [Xanthomonas vasicola]CAD7741628.1 hypothetical protein LMG31884_47830 [Xanthomonas hydrangeae]KGR62632.1 hypothetical protein NX79_00745 [Xanthomonas vasicola]CAD7741632.1 hypothetical protein LMG31884_47830 [Xanthomonas hydrangeae]CAD7748040.1 hypothetical protein LMG31887_46810 [Xanthomonas hydrangeae]CAD7748041.1 hypothetical protein LMG31887_46810 [Xanthomonas hydrangeae]
MNDPKNQHQDEAGAFDDSANAAETLRDKLTDALTPGYQAEFAPDEAERAGAFAEDALSEQEAVESDIDLVDATMPAAPAADAR